jgi:hypothetical protein
MTTNIATPYLRQLLYPTLHTLQHFQQYLANTVCDTNTTNTHRNLIYVHCISTHHNSFNIPKCEIFNNMLPSNV